MPFRPCFVIVVSLTAALVGAPKAAAQDVYPVELFRDLPSANVFALLEAAQPEVTTDRFNSGGLNAGDPDRVSAFLASWSQTQYRLGDVQISSPVDGTPMLFPDLAWFERITVSTGVMPADANATGLAIGLAPRAPTERWTGLIEIGGSGGGLASESPDAMAPAIVALEDSRRLHAVVSGRSSNGRLGAVLGGSWLQSTTLERGSTMRDASSGSVFANATFDVSASAKLHAIAWAQPGDALHLQTTLERNDRWRVFGGYTWRSTLDRHVLGDRIAIDRLTDGPVPFAIDRGGSESRLIAGGRLTPKHDAHAFTLGADLEWTAVKSPGFTGSVEERIDGVAARIWRYRNPGIDSQRHALLLNAFADDRIALGKHVTVDGSIRFDSASASADGASNGISWQTVLPAAHLYWDIGTPLHFKAFTGVSRSADQPLLGMLAYGDPNASTGDVYRWDGGTLPASPVVARVGPGTGGDTSFSAIDPDLKRPITDQFVFGLESTPLSTLRLSVVGLARRQQSLIQVVNTGVPSTGYTMFTVADDNVDLAGTADDQLLPVYNRKPDTFAQDRYLLTNPDLEDARMNAVIVAGVWTWNRVFLRAAGTASRATGPAANRGYTAIENDQSITGEVLSDPNAATYARGRLFNDRAYTIKVMSTVRIGRGFRLGAIARYQDGQPFSRLVIVNGLNQGTEAIRAFSNGLSRFTYRATVDARLQKDIGAGRGHINLIADAYNLLKLSTEVEEYVVTGARYREVTAIQPPRSFHLGARITF
jgi:hypothetical protein